jgi:hypothetical protein
MYYQNNEQVCESATYVDMYISMLLGNPPMYQAK